MACSTMKNRAESGCYLRSVAATPAFYTYLKPGALARLRDSRINARSRQTAAHAVLALIQLKESSDSALPQTDSPDLVMNGVPCFRLRAAKYPRCLQRKKLISILCDEALQDRGFHPLNEAESVYLA